MTLDCNDYFKLHLNEENINKKIKYRFIKNFIVNSEIFELNVNIYGKKKHKF